MLAARRPEANDCYDHPLLQDRQSTLVQESSTRQCEGSVQLKSNCRSCTGQRAVPMAVVFCLLGFVPGRLDRSMQLLDTNLLVGKLLPVLQQLLLKAVDLMSLAGQLSTYISCRRLSVLASIPCFSTRSLPFLQYL